MVYAFEIVYPKSVNVTINSDKTFFIGNDKTKKLTINGKNIKIHQSGAFKHYVNLSYGLNKFIISDGSKTSVYRINRPKLKNSKNSFEMIKYDTPLKIITKIDNCPIRSVPYNGGLNRLAHYQAGVVLNAVGEYENFYKVQLARDDFAWIMKSHTQVLNCYENVASEFYGVDYSVTPDFEVYKFTLSNKLPFVLSEDKFGFKLVIYGLDENKYPLGRFDYSILRNGKKFGYSTYYDDEDNLVVKINNTKYSLKDVNITIDAGHGGSEFGAIDCFGNKEKDINLSIALKLRDKLKNAGANVFMIREDDKFVSLSDRVEFSNSRNSQIFISIHNNALSDSLADKDKRGTEVYYFYSQAKPLAKAVSNGITNHTGLINNGIYPQSFAVVRNTNAVSILVEAGYLIDPEDDVKLIESDFQDKIVDGILNGLENYLNDR